MWLRFSVTKEEIDKERIFSEINYVEGLKWLQWTWTDAPHFHSWVDRIIGIDANATYNISIFMELYSTSPTVSVLPSTSRSRIPRTTTHRSVPKWLLLLATIVLRIWLHCRFHIKEIPAIAILSIPHWWCLSSRTKNVCNSQLYGSQFMSSEKKASWTSLLYFRRVKSKRIGIKSEQNFKMKMKASRATTATATFSLRLSVIKTNGTVFTECLETPKTFFHIFSHSSSANIYFSVLKVVH